MSKISPRRKATDGIARAGEVEGGQSVRSAGRKLRPATVSGGSLTQFGDSAAETHFWLTQGMARTAGVNLTEAIAAGLITRADLASMVVRCGGCQYSERCVRWMAGLSHEAEGPPDYCLNHEMIETLKIWLKD